MILRVINISYSFQLAIMCHPSTYLKKYSSIDNFEKGFLKRTNAHISVTFDAVSQRMKISAQNEKAGQAFIPKAIGSTLRLRSNNDRKTYRKRKTHFQI